MDRQTILNQMKGNILESDYNSYIINPKQLINFKYFSPFYNIEVHCSYLRYFIIDFCDEYGEMILSKMNYLQFYNIKNMSKEFYEKLPFEHSHFILSIPKEQRTHDFYKQEIQKNGFILEYLDESEQTYDLCLLAVKNSPETIQFIQNINHKTKEIYRTVICNENKYGSFNLTHFITNSKMFNDIEQYELWKEIIAKQGRLIYECNKSIITDELCEIAIKNDGSGLGHLKQQTYELCKIAVSKYIYNISSIKDEKFLTDEIYKIAIKNNYEYLKNIKEEKQTDDLIKYAINLNVKAIFHIHNEEKRNYYIKENQYDVLCALVTEQCHSVTSLKSSGGRL